MVRFRWWVALPLAVGLCAAAAPAEEVGWQEAVARLAQERTQAETCVRALKTYGSAAAIRSGALGYDDAKAEYDAIIAGLDVALARDAAPASLPDLQARLKRGFDKREAFCRTAQALVPPDTGTKGALEEIVSGAVGPVVEAVKAIYLRSRDDDALMRATIRTQLEATTWPAFASVAPSP